MWGLVCVCVWGGGGGWLESGIQQEGRTEDSRNGEKGAGWGGGGGGGGGQGLGGGWGQEDEQYGAGLWTGDRVKCQALSDLNKAALMK